MTGTETVIGDPLIDETGRPTARDTATIGGEITLRVGEMTIGGIDVIEMWMTDADAPAPANTAVNDRRLATKIGRTRGDE